MQPAGCPTAGTSSHQEGDVGKGHCGQVSAAFPCCEVLESVMTTAVLLDAFSCAASGSRASAISQAAAAAGT